MSGIHFTMWPEGRELDLLQVLTMVGESSVIESEWRVRDADCAGDPTAAAELSKFSDELSPIPGETLLDLARRRVQLIDGELQARRVGSQQPWLVIEAIDSSRWL